MKTKQKVLIFGAAVLILSLAMFIGVHHASADINGCPTDKSALTSNRVGAHVDVNGNDATYYFDSFVAEGSDGVPGLIEYCVYPDSAPDTVVTVAVGNDSSAWTDPQQFNNFSFQRPDGNPSNIPYDGASHEMGTATYGAGVPNGFDMIVLHINDAEECDRLYGGNPGTCFVLPGSQGGQGSPLGIDKSASGSFDQPFSWTIDKSVDKTTVKQIGGSATFNYTVVVTRTAGSPTNFQASGTITVSNPNSDPVTIDSLTDQLSDGTPCTITGGAPSSVPAGDSTYDYTCSPSDGSATSNTATVTWSDQTLGNGDLLAGGTKDVTVDFSFAENDIDECATVSDTNSNGPQNVSVCDTTTFNYSVTVPVPQYDCVNYDNTASFTTNDTGTTGSDGQRVTVCGPAKTGALTIGFWKTTNGQGLIKTYCVSGGNNLGTYLAGLGGGSGPFSNAPTTCSSLATYVSGILSGASATDMNKMLKAQMLGTALDVWFSGPGWTSTTISKVKPPSNFLSHNSLGTFKMDTTAVCPMVDNTTAGTATCKNNLPSTDAVASGAVANSPMSMQAILDFASTTPAPFNGSTSASIWYGGNRTKQEILKNIFDQFNNQLAFGSF